MKKNKLLWFLGVIVTINLVIWVTDSTHLYKAVLYNFPDLDDYKKFENRTLTQSPNPQPWGSSKCVTHCQIPDQLSINMHENSSTALLFIKGDSIYLEKYWEGYNANTPSNSFSVAKSYISSLVGIAIAEGKIKSVDQPVGDFLEHFKEGENSKLTIKHLLTMSSGLNWEESYNNPLSMTTKAYYGNDLPEIINDLKVVEKTGKTFKYLSGNTQILAMVVAKATGKSVSEYATEKLWHPMGATSDAFWSLDKKDGIEKSYCCLSATARDFARIGKLYRDGGKWNGKQLIPESFVQASTQGHDLIDKDGKPVDYYGYQWWVVPEYKGYKAYYCRGIQGQYVIVIPKLDIVIVRLGHKRGERQSPHHKMIYALIDGAIEFFNHPDNTYYY